jgi:hypothetical protein
MLVRIEFMLAEEHLELEGTFRQYLYKDFINQFESKNEKAKEIGASGLVVSKLRRTPNLPRSLR